MKPDEVWKEIDTNAKNRQLLIDDINSDVLDFVTCMDEQTNEERLALQEMVFARLRSMASGDSDEDWLVSRIARIGWSYICLAALEKVMADDDK